MEAPTPSLNADSCIASVPTQQFLLSDLKPDIAFSWLHGHEQYDCISLYNWFYTCWSLSSHSCFPDRNTKHAFTLCQTVIILEIYEESIGMQPDAPTLAWSRSIISRNVKGVSKANHYCTSLSCNCGILLRAAHSNSKSIPITREDSWSQSTITFCVQWWQHPFNRFSTLINSYSLQDAARKKDLKFLHFWTWSSQSVDMSFTPIASVCPSFKP